MTRLATEYSVRRQEFYFPPVPFIANIRLGTRMIKQCLELSSNLQRPFRSRNNLAYVFS